ncbi:MAG: hypothetical protein V4613_07480 [Bacteroidota bacterium]
MKKKSFEEQLNHKTSEFSLTPRAGLWGEIEPHLVPEKRKRRAIVFWFWIGASAFISTVAAYSFFVSGTHSSPKIAIHPTIIPKVKMPVSDSLIVIQPKEEVSAPTAFIPTNQLIPKSAAVNQYKTHLTSQSNNKNSLSNESIADLENFTPVQKTETNPSNTITVIDELTPSEIIADSSVIAAINNSQDIPKKDSVITGPKKANSITFYTGFSFAPLLSHSALSLGKQSSQSNTNAQYDRQYRQKTDKSIWGFTVGWTGGFEKNRHHLYTGLQYSKMGYQLLVKNIERIDLVSTSVPFVYQNVATDSFALRKKDDGASYVTNSFHYLNIPIGYSYQLMNKSKFSIGINGQLSYNYLLHSKALLYDESSGYYIKQNVQNESQLSRSNLIIGGGFEINYNLNKNSSLSFRPLYHYTLKPVETAAINTRIHALELALSWRWYFR